VTDLILFGTTRLNWMNEMKYSIYIFTGMALAPVSEFDSRDLAEGALMWLIEHGDIPLPPQLFHLGPSPSEFKKNGALRPMSCLLPAIA
jgi:hypothetical protein